jgi:hypothetical protein
MRGIRIDIVNLSKDVFKTADAQANVVSADLAIWEEASRLGDDLCQELRDVALTPWPPLRVLSLVWRRLTYWVNLVVAKVHEYAPNRLKVWLSSRLMRTIGIPQLAAAAKGGALSESLPGPVNAQNFSPEFRELVAEVSNFIEKVALPGAMPNFNNNREEALKHLLIDFQSATALERASRYIFGSQVDALIYLATVSGTATRMEITRYYEAAKTTSPEMYANYSFEGWLEFLTNNHLISANGDTVSSTPLGKAAVRYMRDRGYLTPHPKG